MHSLLNSCSVCLQKLSLSLRSLLILTCQSEEYICEIAQEAIDLACKKSAGPLVHKVMLHKIINHMFDWHCSMAKTAP